jgi:Arc/MetJ-type ribon-helix-helix transcriptional regulator
MHADRLAPHWGPSPLDPHAPHPRLPGAGAPGSPSSLSDLPGRGMGTGMATKKVTVTLEADQLAAIRSLVEARSTKSVSAFVQHAVAVSLDDVAGWGALLAGALERTGGPLTKEERTWADGVFSQTRRKRRSTRKRAA